MKKVTFFMILAVGFLALVFYSVEVNAVTTIDILNPGDSGTTSDGTVFLGDPNPTSPSTGTGVFQPFFRVGAGNGSLDYGGGQELGFNTDANHPQINFDTKDGSNWTRSVSFSELAVINGYYVLQLDANQVGSATSVDNQILITQMEIFIAPGLSDPEASKTGIQNTGYNGTLFDGKSTGDTLLGIAPVWSLNGASFDWQVLLQASICDSSGNCGSGHGDLDVFIPKSLLSGAGTDNFVLYTEYAGANDGYEEWRFNSTSVPEPGMASLLVTGLGLIGLGLFRRRCNS